MAESGIDAGTAALKEASWQAAADAFRSVLDGEQEAEALLGLGQALWWLGNMPDAMAHLERAYAAFRRRPDPVYAAACALRLGFHHRAVAATGRRVMSMVFDAARQQAFAEQALGIVNGGFLSLMLSVGHRTGLFDTLATLGPSSSEQIAAAAGLNERYVREWLGAMVTGRILEYDASSRTYRLPREHAASLTRAAGPDNLAGLAQLVSLLGNVETAIVDVFRKGGGVDYSAFERFHDLMAESSRTTLAATLLTHTLPLVPGLAERLEAGIDVLDVGCGQGVASLILARRFPRSRFVGLDIAADAIAAAQAEAERAGVANTRFLAQDAAGFQSPQGFDFVTAFDAIHDQAAPRRVLRAIRQSLRPGGVFLMADIAASSHLERNLDNPLAPLLFTISTMHCMTVSLAHGGEGLGACWGEEKARELLAEAGFSTVDVSRVEGDPLNAYYACRP